MSHRPGGASGTVLPHSPTPGQRLIAQLVRAAVCACASTQRVRFSDPHATLESIRQHPVIFAAWHNRLALAPIVYRRLVAGKPGQRRMAALVSASRDGALLAAILEAFGAQPVRGSTSRRGPQALLELTSWAERGLDLAITPDGPRGPRCVVQPGVIAVARVTGFPIVPIACNTGWKIGLRSWDRFQIPLPGGAYEIALGPALTIPPDAVPLSPWQTELEGRLLAITRD